MSLPPLPKPRVQAPLVVRVTRLLMALLAVLWTVGAYRAAHHLIRAARTESAADRGADLVWLGSRVALSAVAALAVLGLARRRAFGRWASVAAIGGLLYLGSPSLAYSWRAAHGDLSMPSSGALAYSTPTEATAGLVTQLCISAALVALALRLALARAVGEYLGGRAD